jgi:hypothetical protein
MSTAVYTPDALDERLAAYGMTRQDVPSIKVTARSDDPDAIANDEANCPFAMGVTRKTGLLARVNQRVWKIKKQAPNGELVWIVYKCPANAAVWLLKLDNKEKVRKTESAEVGPDDLLDIQPEKRKPTEKKIRDRKRRREIKAGVRTVKPTGRSSYTRNVS